MDAAQSQNLENLPGTPHGLPGPTHIAAKWRDYVTDAALHLDARDRRHENYREARWAYRDLNLFIGPPQPKQLALVSSEDGIGKTTFALDLCRAETFERGNSCLLIAPSTSRTEIALRLLAAEAGATRIGNLGSDRPDAIRRAGDQTVDANLYLTAGAPMTMEDALEVAHATWRMYDLELIVIDDADLLTPAHRPSPLKAIGQLRQLADDLHLPVVVTARVIRDPHPDYSRPPLDHQLWSVGADTLIDTSILLHRPDADGVSVDRIGEIDLYVKPRNGAPHVVTLNFQGHRSRMTDKPWTAPPDN